MGREVQCGAGTIVFFGPPSHNSSLARLLGRHGFGAFGISIEVADLGTAQKVIEEATHRKFVIQHSGSAISFVVPAEAAAGTYFEFIQQL
jgi:hypothetical protein